ncbi:MAG: histidine kinase [Clostridiales bacterium]|nr:histidine kinase [Clostridiales bacterium]
MLREMDRLFGKKQNSLMKQYVLLVLIIFFVLIVSFIITNDVADYSSMKESRESSKVIFRQAEDQAALYEEDINNMYSNIIYNESVISFLKASDYPTRAEYLDNFYLMVGSNRRINKDLVNVALYDTDDNLIASKGDIFIPKPEFLKHQKLVSYSGRINDQGVNYFITEMLVYEYKKESCDYIGTVVLLFDVKNLQEILDKSLINKEATIAILDQNGNVLVKAGAWKKEYCSITEREKQKADEIVYNKRLEKCQWNLVNVIPRKSLIHGISQMKRLNYMTYMAVIIISIFMCFMVYKRIIRPIRLQAAFMARYTKDTNQRINVLEHNEIGEMAEKMNQMLDDIERLNAKIMESQKKYLQLEYAKKQSELIAYKSQINPHFLYNMFECLRGMALYHGQKEIADFTQLLSHLFRYNVKGGEWVTVEEVLKNLREYARIIEFQFMGRYQLNVTAGREVLSVKIPKMLIQPLVENAVFHGLKLKPGKGAVEVRVEKKAGSIVITVTDNGCGMSDASLQSLRKTLEGDSVNQPLSSKKHGIGILNVYHRLHLYYGEKADFRVKSEANIGTIIELVIPIN